MWKKVWLRTFIVVTAAIFLGCERLPEEPVKETEAIVGVSLAWTGQPFDIMVNDLDKDGDQDLFVIDHGASHGQFFLQKKPREFTKGQVEKAVGFHPGNVIPLPGDESQFVLAAEGENEIRTLQYGIDGFKVTGALPALRPRYGAVFRWPGWGNSLAITPYDLDEIHLFRDFSPQAGKTKAVLPIPLAKKRPSALWPGRITVADTDADGVDELYFVTPVTKDIFVIRAPKSRKSVPIPELVYRGMNDWGIPDEVIDTDMNGDGLVDLLLPELSKPGRINVLINQGKGKFQPVQAIDAFPTRGITKLKAAVDHDGFRYLLAGSYGSLAIYRIPLKWLPGDPIQRREIRWKGNAQVSALCLKDVDGDGWLDAVIGRLRGESTLHILFGPLWDTFGLASVESREGKKSID